LELADYAVHTRMARLAEAAEWTLPAAEALTRAAALSRGPQRALLERRAAALYNALGEHGLSADALRRALLAHPGDEQAFSLLFSQLSAAEERERLLHEFVETLFQALASDPSEPDLLRTLVHTGHTGHRAALEQLGLFTLEALAQASREELAQADRLRSLLPERPRGKLIDASFLKLLPRTFNADALALARSVSAAWLELSPDTQQQRKQGRSAARESHPLRATLTTGLEVFGLSLGEIYVSETEKDALYSPSITGNAQSWVIGRDFQSPAKRDTLLRVVPLMAAGRAGLLGLADDNVNEVQRRLSLVLAAVGVLDEPGLTGEAAELAAKLSRGTRNAVVSAWQALAKKDDVPARFARAVVNLGRRAALVCSGDVIAVANRLAEARKISLRAACVTPAGLELLRFWLSPACAELIEQLGVCP
jgi:hypothetical protein